MIIAVGSVRMMQVPVNEVVHVIAVRDRFVAAVGAVNVVGRMAAAVVAWRAVRWIGRGHGDAVFVNMIAVGMMQVTIVQVVRVAVVLDRGVAAAWTMLMIVVSMDIAGILGGFVGHWLFLG